MSTEMRFPDLDSFLSELPEMAAEARSALKGQNGRFLLKTTDGRSWAVLLRDGLFTVEAPDGGAYDCSVTVDSDVLLRIINGQYNPAKALLTRKIRTEGDVGRLMPLLRML